MLASGNPAGLFFIASGGLSFCESKGCQISADFLRLAGGATTLAQASAGDGGSFGGATPGADGGGGFFSPAVFSGFGGGFMRTAGDDDLGGRGPLGWWRLGRFIGPTMGFQTFDAFKRAFGPAGPGKEYHHIVQQTAQNVEQFGSWFVHNTRNIMPLDATIHHRITGFYNSSISPGGPLVRDVVSQWRYVDQFNFGMEAIRRFGGTP